MKKKIEVLGLPLNIASAWIAFMMRRNNGDICDSDWEIVINWMKWISSEINNFNDRGIPIDINGIEDGLNFILENDLKYLTIKRDDV